MLDFDKKSGLRYECKTRYQIWLSCKLITGKEGAERSMHNFRRYFQNKPYFLVEYKPQSPLERRGEAFKSGMKSKKRRKQSPQFLMETLSGVESAFDL